MRRRSVPGIQGFPGHGGRAMTWRSPPPEEEGGGRPCSHGPYLAFFAAARRDAADAPRISPDGSRLYPGL
ncbi:hypothetical protein HYQ46_012633 [Verticillium longisporum]|nr:hypothetical protein HYQ46_012633 [Verticillium longisporum]